MTKEELKQEAEEKYKEWKSEQYKDQSTEEKFEFVEHLHNFPQYFKKAFIAGAESREKRIAELEQEVTELKKRLSDIKLLCYSDGSDGEVLSEIMKYFSKE